jgi:trimeric autotransporter adhesin
MEFHTTDELFAALTVPEIRRVLLQTASDADETGNALRTLLKERYTDFISTADEAASMLAGVRQLVDKVEGLRGASKKLLAAAAAGSAPAAAGASSAANSRVVVVAAPGSPSPSPSPRTTTAAASPASWLAASYEHVGEFVDRGQLFRASVASAAARQLSASSPPSPYARAALPDAHGQVQARASASLAAALARGGRFAGVGDPVAAATARLLALVVLRASSSPPSTPFLPAAAALLPVVLADALLRPAAETLAALLAGENSGAGNTSSSGRSRAPSSRLAARVQRLSVLERLAAAARCFGLCVRAAASAMDGEGGAASSALLFADGVLNAVSTPSASSSSSSALFALTPSPQWRADVAGAAPGGVLPSASDVPEGSAGGAQQVPTELQAAVAECRAVTARWASEQADLVRSRSRSLVASHLGLEESAASAAASAAAASSAAATSQYASADSLSAVTALRRSLASACGAGTEEGGEGFRAALALLSPSPSPSPSPSLDTILFEQPLGDLSALCVRGTLSDTLGQVASKVRAAAGAAAEAAGAGALSAYGSASYSAGGALLPSTSPAASSTVADEAKRSKESIRAASERFKAFVEAKRSGESLARHVDAAADAASSSEPAGRSALLAAGEASLLHTSYPEAWASTATSAASVAVLVAAGVLEVDLGGALRPAAGGGVGAAAPVGAGAASGPVFRAAHMDKLLARVPASVQVLLEPRAWQEAGSAGGWGHPLGTAFGYSALALAGGTVAALHAYAARAPADAPPLAKDGHALAALASLLETLVGEGEARCVAAKTAASAASALPAASSALLVGHTAVLLHALLPEDLLASSGPATRDGPAAASVGEALLACAAACTGAWATVIGRHAAEAARWEWARSGVLAPLGSSGGASSKTAPSAFAATQTASAASAASARWRSENGGWMSANLDAADGEASAQIAVPVGVTPGLAHAFARLAAHVRLAGLLEAPPTVRMTAAAAEAVAGGEAATTSSSVAVAVELGLVAPLDYDFDPARVPGAGEGEGELDVWGVPRDHFSSSGATASGTAVALLDGAGGLRAGLALRAARLAAQTAATAVLRRELLAVYDDVAAALGPPGSAGSAPEGWTGVEAPTLQALLDVFVMGHALPSVQLGPSASSASASTIPAGIPSLWRALAGGASTSSTDLAASLGGDSAAAPSTPSRLWGRMSALLDPVDWRLLEGQVRAFGADAAKAHAVSWHAAAPALGPQALPGGLSLAYAPTEASGRVTWRLADVLVPSQGPNKAGVGAAPSAPAATAASSSSSSFSTATLTQGGISVSGSAAASLLALALPVAVASADLEPSAVPVLPLQPPFARLPLLPAPILTRAGPPIHASPSMLLALSSTGAGQAASAAATQAQEDTGSSPSALLSPSAFFNNAAFGGGGGGAAGGIGVLSPGLVALLSPKAGQGSSSALGGFGPDAIGASEDGLDLADSGAGGSAATPAKGALEGLAGRLGAADAYTFATSMSSPATTALLGLSSRLTSSFAAFAAGAAAAATASVPPPSSAAAPGGGQGARPGGAGAVVSGVPGGGAGQARSGIASYLDVIF